MDARTQTSFIAALLCFALAASVLLRTHRQRDRWLFGILATNTSTLPVIEMAMATQRPDQVCGIHFFNPAPVMQLVELIRGIATDEPTFQACKSVVDRLGKYPGFTEQMTIDGRAPRMAGGIRASATGALRGP